MTDIAKAELTKDLIRAQDALQSAFKVACRVGDLDLANDLRKRRLSLADTITKVNGGPVKISGSELLGAFR